jgi:hypothetical protein
MRLDKSVCKKQSYEAAADHQATYRQMDATEQAESYRYLLSVAYGLVGRDWPRMEKTVFRKRLRDETLG